jgi:molybdopterin-guanine dinucleotide biosynthesis protein A
VAANAPGTADLVTVSTDSPFLPTDLVARLIQARNAAGAEIFCAASAGQAHPVAGLWPVRLAPLLRQALVEERLHRIDRWTARFALVHVAFPAEPFDPFLNVNTPDDLAAAEAWLNWYPETIKHDTPSTPTEGTAAFQPVGRDPSFIDSGY